MRRVFLAVAIAAAAVLAAGPASAQVKLPNIVVTPKIQTAPVVRTPIIKIIPPSMALSRVMALVPNSQALSVKLKGPLYIVKVKKGKEIVQKRVNAVSGAVVP